MKASVAYSSEAGNPALDISSKIAGGDCERGISLGAFAFFALGYTLVGLVPSARAVVVIGNVVLYPLVIFSDAVVPLEIMPDTVRTVSRFLPLTHQVALLRGLWVGGGWGDLLIEAAVLAGMGLVGTLVVAWTFRWE
jgi:ABC-2 type transport system permease protein